MEIVKDSCSNKPTIYTDMLSGTIGFSKAKEKEKEIRKGECDRELVQQA